ncbi:preprotein translocase subunit SecD [Methanoculleus horonobensis]|jgi:preprotein translocase subunit SecD|uniref:preprotein translocase subunit SecD n=1 Tax=Methanoculleus horonobensis TaxID=528314 RepID=UPI00082C1A62|nr:preprotein translocase subunit SecD [Methanoculleus horonobensis]MDD3071899.1 preprotein translocase subunit SecD [Methanoculleus horonobensis]MDD4253247.1 preprotein translocase subunit SecD [Methanoculleus horonobensis]
MNGETIKTLIKDWRVALVLLLVVGSLVGIYLAPPSPEKGLEGNLQFGLDLEGGSWLQMEFQSVVVAFSTEGSVGDLMEDLRTGLETEVIRIDENHIEIRKSVTRADLEPIFAQSGASIVTYQKGVSPFTADEVKRILNEKVNALGMQDARINLLTPTGSEFPQYVRIELAGVDMATAQDIVGQQGLFEIRVQTAGNETEHVLYGDQITSVGVPQKDLDGRWGVSFTLTETGAEAFREAAVESGAVDNPDAHNLVMILDNETVYSAPLSGELAGQLRSGPVRSLSASTGTGDAGLEDAMTLQIHLRAGALPVKVDIVGSGSVPAALGEQFKMTVALAGLLALLTVAVVVYYRYREPSIVIPMVAINLAEIIILLGISRFIIQLDLATIAGLIAVVGTGIDQLVIITDEVLHEGRVPSPNLYMKRYGRALGIIAVAAATVFIAMLPLALMDLSTLRGFAIITILGVLIGILVTRPAYGKIIMAILSK